MGFEIQAPGGAIDKRALRHAIDQAFNAEELKLLCADLDGDLKAAGKGIAVSLDEIGGDAKAVRIQNLIEYLERRGCLDFLIEAVRRERPGLIADPPPKPSFESARQSYLNELSAWLDKQARLYLYTPLSGKADIEDRKPPPSAVLSPLYEHGPSLFRDLVEQPRERRSYEDILTAFEDLRRAVLIGEPGAGKTTSLLKLAAWFAEQARRDPAAPVPVFVRLAEWRGDQLLDFAAARTGPLQAFFGRLLDEEKVVLLLDGLNEIPTTLQQPSVEQIAEFLRDTETRLIVSCRERDYRDELRLDLDTLAIRPLPPRRVRAFIRRYLGDYYKKEQEAVGKSEELFWSLAGGEEVRRLWEAWRTAGVDDLDDFWRAKQPPDECRYDRPHRIWHERVQNDSRSLIFLAGNPFMLWMFIAVYCQTGQLPPNRAGLFERFIKILLAREKLADIKRFEVTRPGNELLRALSELAWRMQQVATEQGEDEVQISLDYESALPLINNEQLRRAASASLLETGERVRFGHQLLQEYFVALGMHERLKKNKLNAGEIWLNKWERTGWEEATVLLAGLYAKDCTSIIEWLQDVQPEVAADCVNRSGAKVPRETLERLRAVWVSRLTDTDNELDPRARAAVGRALGSLEIDGYPLDNRKGVWGIYLPNEKRAVVDIDWVEIPGGEFIYQGDEQRELETFFMSQYLVTYSQFQAFIDDPEGYASDIWWKDLKRYDAPEVARWTYHNHPREMVRWYEAVAFCRWLSKLRDEAITLPTEWQWERAARGCGGRQYPWGAEWHAGCANTWESKFEQTSVVGIYPAGRARYGAQNIDDLAGNVWEWCLNKFFEPENIAIDQSDDPRVVRGGSWLFDRSSARAVFRLNPPPLNYSYDRGIRLVRPTPHP